MTTEMLTLKAESPLALHRRRAGEQFAPTLDYLPGSAVRGALADVYLKGDAARSKDKLFHRLFLSEAVAFSDFLPVPDSKGGLPRLIPATAMACKRFSEHERDSLTDGLLRLELARELGQPAPLEHNQWNRCPECRGIGRNEKRDRAEPGYFTSLETFQRISIRKRMIANTAIERATGTAAHAMLFSHEVIEESSAHKEGAETLFRGIVTMPDDLRSDLLNLARRRDRLAVGYGRSRGLGQLSVEGWGGAPPLEPQSLAERWESLNQAARALWKRFDRELQGRYFSLTLQSHLALRNEADEPVLGEVTAADLGLPAADRIERCRCVLNSALVSGWNAAQNLPKADTWALARGSVLLFRLLSEADPKPVMERLAEIEREGLGERRAEGFGRVIVCDRFHYYFLEKELKGVLQ